MRHKKLYQAKHNAFRPYFQAQCILGGRCSDFTRFVRWTKDRAILVRDLAEVTVLGF